MAKDYEQRVRIKGEFDTSSIETSMRKIIGLAQEMNATQKFKMSNEMSKVISSFQKLDNMTFKGIANVSEMKEFEKLLKNMTKNLNSFYQVANEASAISIKPQKESLKNTRNAISEKMVLSGNNSKQSLLNNYMTALEEENKKLSRKEIDNINYQNLFNKSLKETIELMTKIGEASTSQKTKDTINKDIKTMNSWIGNYSEGSIGKTVEGRSIMYQNEVRNTLEQEQLAGKMVNELNNYSTAQGHLAETARLATTELTAQLGAQKQINDQFAHFQNYVGYMFSFASILTSIKRVIRDTFNDVEQLDKAFGSIAMVTNYSVQDMWSSYDKYSEMANRLGQSTKDVIESSALFYQQGLKTADALSLTESTMKLATLAGSDFSTATSQMTAAIRGFNLEMEDSSHITDVYSELAANAAADVNGIAYALSKAAAIADSAGMSFENTAAFLAKMIESTQEAPENLGTALKTVIARFTELKTDVSGLTETELESADLNKVDTALKSVGVQLKKSNGEFRNLDEVFLELSSKWNTLSRNSQRYVATIAAGSRLNVNRLHLAA